MSNFSQALRSHMYGEMKKIFSGDSVANQSPEQNHTIGRLISDTHIEFRALGANEDEISCISALALLHANGVVPIARDKDV